MSKPRDNLTGFLVGRYAYDCGLGDPVQFIAMLDESEGHMLSGTISEPNHMGAHSKELHAFISGNRDGSDVFFAKTYDGASDAAHRVDYYGVLGDEGRRIVGHWTLPGTSGSFEMSREILDETEEEAVVFEEVEILRPLS